MKNHSILMIVALALCLSSYLNAQTSMFGSNPQHTGVYQSDFASNLKLTKKWKFKTNGMIFSSATVVNDVAYIGSDDSCLYAINAEGSQKWKFLSNGKIRSTPAVKDSVVYFNNYGGMFYALNNKTGQTLWSFKTEGDSPRTGKGLNWFSPNDSVIQDPWDFYLSSPVIQDSMVYFGSGTNVYAMNMTSHELVWKFTAPNVVHSTPAVSGGMIYFGCWDSKFYALNALTGRLVWSFQTGLDPDYHGMEGIQSSPTVVDTIVYISSRDANVYALHAKTGRQLWSQNFGWSWLPSSFAVYNNTLLTGGSESLGLTAMNTLTGIKQFTANNHFYLTFSTPAIASQTAFVGCMNGSLFAVDTQLGTIKCRFDTDGRIANLQNAYQADGSPNPAVFDPLTADAYTAMALSAGGILSSVAIDKSVIYFGSSDSCIYAVFDNGSCRSQLQVLSKSIDLGLTSKGLIDTAIYVSNVGDCLDSVIVYADSLAGTIDIQPKTFLIPGHDSVLVRMRLNTITLKVGMSYAVNITSQSKSNTYDSFKTLISFTKDSATALSELLSSKQDAISPNPLRNYTEIDYSLEQNCKVVIRILNSLGQLEQVLVNENQMAGQNHVNWDGHNSRGVKMTPGLYFCEISKGNAVVTKKIIIAE